MIEYVQNLDLLGKYTEAILSVIKPTENDKKKRLGAIEEIVNSVHVVGVSRDAVRAFGSFASNLYAKSGDLDVAIQLSNDSRFPTDKKKKEIALKKLGRALQTKGVARDVQIILTARVPVLKYVSNHFGISCDISIDNLPGRIKSRVLYWINTLDGRFGDMVLLIKEWARAQNINDPKNGTLSSYAICILVAIYFQNCKPAILPPLKDIFYASIAKGSGGFDATHFHQTWEKNVAKLRRQNIGQRNQSSLSDLLATFFEQKSTYYTGQFKQAKAMAKSCCKIVEDPFDISDKAAIITVDVPALRRITSAFQRASYIINSCEPADGSELLPLLCTPEVGSKLGYTNPAMSPQQHIHTGSTGSGPVRRTQGYNSDRQSAASYWRQ